ncbi:RAS protein activator like-3 [Neolamprologus brichardi]|nr:RAS protein activator like-3 [Neolamprologus brichardi]
MGTEEKDPEPAAQPASKEQGSPEKENEPPQTSETSDPLNTYKWHTGSKGTLNEQKEEGEGTPASSTSAMEKIQKASSNKWSKMQNWRKALSEDPGEKNSSNGKSSDAAKPEKASGGTRKNPFRRALSEPPGSLFAALSTTNSAHAASSSAAATSAGTEASGAASSDPSQKGGGGALFKKYLRSVSQKLKKPKLQPRNSTPSLAGLNEVVPTPAGPCELSRLQWVPPQEVPLWDISNCCLEDGQILISPEEEPTMWTRNRVSSCLSNLSMQNLVDIDTDCSPDHGGQLGPRPKAQDGGVRGLIKRRLENKAKRNSNTQLNQQGLNKGRRLYESRESVSIPVSPVGTLDLSADTSTVIRPHPLGSVTIPLADIRGRTYQEKWYPITPYKASGSAGNKEALGPQASLRIKARFQNLQVLPMEKYKEFAEYVTVDYVEMCRNLEPLLNVKEKEELAGALVHVLQSIGKAKEFLIDLGNDEVERLGEKEAMIFRENTLATKAIDEYMKLVGQKYLIDTLGEFINRLYASTENCEVDPRKCPAAELSSNQKHLRETCEEVVQKIIELHGPFPEELNRIFSSWVEVCEDQGKPEIGHRLISASLFLRFLCPAILSPSLFGLTQPYPEPNTLRTLTLTAKVIQNLANFTLFGEKEEYMLFMNEFLEQHWDGMRGFLQTVSSGDTEIAMTSFDGYVDLPLRLAVLHGLLVDIIYQKDQETVDKLHPLPSILNQITESLGPEAPRIDINSQTGHIKPVYIPPKDLSKYSPLQSSLQHIPQESKSTRDNRSQKRKPIARTQSAPHRRPAQVKREMKRQTSSEALPTSDHEQEADPNQPLISPPNTSISVKRAPAPVPWIKPGDPNPPGSHTRQPSEIKTENEQFSLLDKHAQELSELRLGIEQVTERELDMAKRLEDFIIQSQDQNAILQEEVNELRNVLAMREEQLASATFRLGVIEEEREEDERKLSVAIAAAERVNVLEEQFAGLLRDLQQLSEAYKSSQNNTQHPEKPLNTT